MVEGSDTIGGRAFARLGRASGVGVRPPSPRWCRCAQPPANRLHPSGGGGDFEDRTALEPPRRSTAPGRGAASPPSAARRRACPSPGAIDRPSMPWPAAISTLSSAGAAVDDRLAVGRHRPPAAPLLLDRLAPAVRAGSAAPLAQELQAARVERGVVAGELHRRAEAVARLHRRDGDAVLLEDQRDARARRRAAAS